MTCDTRKKSYISVSTFSNYVFDSYTVSWKEKVTDFQTNFISNRTENWVRWKNKTTGAEHENCQVAAAAVDAALT